ncbi:MAG: hypothetical protein KA354_03200 [Phycisphaerae bacterium]|nr:hypothetical protein [Phycisphaerae bacterium]
MPLMALSEFLDMMERIDPGLGALLIGAGLVFMLVGARVFKVLLAISIAAIGFLVCWSALPWDVVTRVLTGVGVGVGLGFAGVFLVRAGVVLLAGGWAGLTCGTLAGTFGANESATWVVAGVGFVLAVSLVFVYYQEVIALITSLEGTLLFLSGMIALLSRFPSFWRAIRPIFQDAPFFAAFAVLAGTVTGYYLQIAELQKKKLGTSG